MNKNLWLDYIYQKFFQANREGRKPGNMQFSIVSVFLLKLLLGKYNI